jgi:hypothetical protein
VKLIPINKCKIKDCPAKRANVCYKNRKIISNDLIECDNDNKPHYWRECKAIRTILPKSAKEILFKMKNSNNLLYWAYEPLLRITTKCRSCGNDKDKVIKILSDTFWLLYFGQYIEEKGDSRTYKLTNKGIATIYKEYLL